MKNIQKRSVIAAIVVCAGAAIMAGVVSKQPVKETTFPLQAEEPLSLIHISEPTRRS